MDTGLEIKEKTRLTSAVALRAIVVSSLAFGGYLLFAAGVFLPNKSQAPDFACSADDASPKANTLSGSDSTSIENRLIDASIDLGQVFDRWPDKPGADALKKIRTNVGERKTSFVAAMRESPEFALKYVLNSGQRAKVKGMSSNCVESPVLAEGTLTVMFADGPRNTHLGKPSYFLETSKGETLTLHPANAPTDYRSGKKLSIKGLRIGQEVLFDAAPLAAAGTLDAETDSAEATAAALPLYSTGEQRVAVILANFNNTPQPTATVESIRKTVFDNVAAYYRENSYGKVTVTGSVFGWYTLPTAQRCESQSGSYIVRDMALAAANADIDYRQFNRVIVVAPYGGFVKCGWIGMSQVGPLSTVTPDGTVKLSSAWVDAGSAYFWTFAHEFGHSLGNMHAQFITCTAQQYLANKDCMIPKQDEYGDIYDAMGWGQGHFDIQHKANLGWMDPGSVITAENQAATYVLEPIESETDGVKGIVVPRPSVPGTTLPDALYLEYRRPMGFDQILDDRDPPSDVFSGILLHARGAESTATGLLDPTDPYHDPLTAALPVGTTYVDPPSGAQIAVLRITDANAVVSIAPGRVGGGTTPVFNGAGPSTIIRYPLSTYTISGSMTISVEATGPKGVQRVEFYHDGSIPAPVLLGTDTTAPYTLTVDTTKMPNGNNHLTILAYDRAGEPYGVNGNKTMVGVFFQIRNYGDTIAPQVSMTGPADGTSVNSPVTLAATASDNRGVWYVDFYNANTNVKIGRSYYPPYSISFPVSTSTTQRVYARAFDFSGNVGSSSTISFNAVTFSGGPDTTPPVVTITTPETGVQLPGGIVTIRVNAQDAVGATIGWIDVNGVLTDWSYSAPPYTFHWDARKLPPGTYTIQAFATDDDFNEGRSTPITVTLLSIPPAITLDRPADGASVEGGVELAVTASSPYGIKTVDFYRDTFALIGTSSVAPYLMSWNGQAPFGLHALHAVARDTIGNITGSTPALITLTDLTPPAITIISPAADEVFARQLVTFNARITDSNGVASAELLVDGVQKNQWGLAFASTNTLFSYALDTRTVPDGSHIIAYRAIDTYGNVQTIERTIIVDNTAPEIALQSPVLASRYAAQVDFSALAGDFNYIAWVEFTVDGNIVAGDVPNLSDINIETREVQSQYSTNWYAYPENLTSGNHVVTATATDFAGNTKTAEPITIYIDATPPTTAITSPASSAVIEITAITADASDDVDVTRVEFYRDAEADPFATDDTAPYAASVATKFFSEGTFSLTTRAYDDAGNTANSLVTSITVDQTKPTGMLVQPVTGTALTGTVGLEATATDNFTVDRVEFLLDGSSVIGTAASSPYRATWNSNATSNGTHRLSARIIDAAGNTFETSRTSYTVSNTSTTGTGGCFSADTTIDTPFGSKPIALLRPGDIVFTYDIATGRTVLGRVDQLLIHPSEPYGGIAFSDGSFLRTTAVHRFFAPDTNEWKAVGDMRVGDRVQRGLGSSAHPVTIQSMEFTSARGAVYNLEVNRFHTFYAGGILVHNAKQRAR